MTVTENGCIMYLNMRDTEKEKREPMLAEERFNEIIRLVNEKKTVTVQELTEYLDTSESTIRRDLTTLHKKKALVKVHGGATALDMGYTTKDVSVSSRQDMNIEEKMQIAEYASKLIEKDDFVYLDAGTSIEFLIDCITEREAVYVTNAILHARKLSKKGCRVFLLGGELKESTEAIVGAQALESLDKYHFTKGFFGTNGVHPDLGITTPEINEAVVKEKAFRQCKEGYILADSSKINQVSSVKFADFEDGFILTTALKDRSFGSYENVIEVEKE